MDPLIYLLALGFGLGAYVTRIEGLSYIQFIAPGLIASSIMTAASFETTINTFVRINFDKVYEAMMATPVTVEDIVVGELMWATTRSTIYATVMLAVVVSLGLVHSVCNIRALHGRAGGFNVCSHRLDVYFILEEHISRELFLHPLRHTTLPLLRSILSAGPAAAIREGHSILQSALPSG